MKQDDDSPDAVADAWLEQMESAVKKTESLCGFYRLCLDERRPGEEVDAFFHGKTALELMDSQAFLRMLQMQWERAKPSIDFSKVGEERAEKIRAVEMRMKSALNQECAPAPHWGLDFR